MIRGNAVRVAKLHQAQCQLDGCDWVGELFDTYQEANGSRQDHLNWHRDQVVAS